jgi:hypothetical protein
MELKDMILSTLAELEEVQQPRDTDKVPQKNKPPLKEEKEEKIAPKTHQEGLLKAPNHEENETKKEVVEEEVMKPLNEEKAFYENLRERILVLFEGFQSPNNKNIEAKLDLTLNFLEYLLASIDERLENLES